METCQRCGTEFFTGVSNCPGCGWPAGAAFPPEKVAPVATNVVPDAEPEFVEERVAARGPAFDSIPEPWQRAGSPEQVPLRQGFSWGWAVLGFFLPIVGIAYGIFGRGRNPAAAHAALIGGLIGLFLQAGGGLMNGCANAFYW